MKDGRAVGVKANSETADYTINAKAVILATGGFGGNEQMIVENNADLAGYVSTNAPGATGDGIVMALWIWIRSSCIPLWSRGPGC